MRREQKTDDASKVMSPPLLIISRNKSSLHHYSLAKLIWVLVRRRAALQISPEQRENLVDIGIFVQHFKI